MQTFTDIHGNKWTVGVTVNTVKRVKALLGIDMINDIEGFIKQMQCIITRCDVLYVVCQDEAVERNISDAQFAGGLAGSVLRESYDALMEAYAAFIPDPEAAAKLRVVQEKYNAVGEKILALIDKKMPQIERKMDEEVAVVLDEIEKQIDSDLSTTGNSSTNVPESSGSIRRRSRSANSTA